MKCLNCGKSLGFNQGDCKTYSISWRKVGDICTKISLCSSCWDSYEDCLPSDKECDLYFGKSKKKKRKKRRKK